MSTSLPRTADSTTPPPTLAPLRTDRAAWRRTAEIAGLVAGAMLIAAGVIPW